jgi:multiple sugar transport system permease protein
VKQKDQEGRFMAVGIKTENQRTGLIPLGPWQINLKKWKKRMVAYLFLAPFVILFTIFIIVPVAISFGLSFTRYNMLESPVWIGLTNFKILLMDDDIFIIALKNTMIFALITGPIGYMMSFLSAWIINQIKFKNAFALAFYAPSITSGVAISVVWMYFFSGDRYGLINNILIDLGIIIPLLSRNKSSAAFK